MFEFLVGVATLTLFGQEEGRVEGKCQRLLRARRRWPSAPCFPVTIGSTVNMFLFYLSVIFVCISLQTIHDKALVQVRATRIVIDGAC